MAPLSAALLLWASLAAGEGVTQRAAGAAALSQSAASAPDDAQSREAAAAAFDGGPQHEDGVSDDGRRVVKKGIPLTKHVDLTAKAPEVPAPGADRGRDKSDKLSTSLMLGGAAALGGLQGWFTAGLLGAAAGAGMGLAAAWLFHKKDYGGAFGVTAGAIVGTALGGPIGGLIGAVVGGVLGHFLGKLFL